MKHPLFFKPICQERVWGGRQLERALGRDLPEGAVIGESWEIVDRPEAQSLAEGGEGEGLSLRALIERDPEGLMGPGYEAARPFPLLVKWLDCSDRLSVQVHPPAAAAGELGGEPKTENWYVAERREGAALYVGLRRGVTREEFERRLAEETLEECLHKAETDPGDSLLVKSGRLHAIGGGNLILEIQQNSDTTYRVYDWGRKGLDGKPRELHVEASLRCIDWNDFEPAPMKTEGASVLLADCEEFRLVKRTLGPGEPPLELEPGQPRLLSVVEGSVSVASEAGLTEAAFGRNALLPAAGAFALRAAAPASVILTDRFV